MKKLEQARDTLNEVLSSAKTKEDPEPYDTEDEEMSPNSFRQPTVSDAIEAILGVQDRAVLVRIKALIEQRISYFDNKALTEQLLGKAAR